MQSIQVAGQCSTQAKQLIYRVYKDEFLHHFRDSPCFFFSWRAIFKRGFIYTQTKLSAMLSLNKYKIKVCGILLEHPNLSSPPTTFRTSPPSSRQIAASSGRPHPQAFSGVEQRWRKFCECMDLFDKFLQWIAWHLEFANKLICESKLKKRFL